MSHSNHKIVKCGTCGKVIYQCRCFDKNKPVEIWEKCDQCYGLREPKNAPPMPKVKPPLKTIRGVFDE